MTSSADAIIAARRARIVEMVDARGRTIGVRRLRPSEQLHVVEAAEDGSDLVPLLCAAAVAFIETDGVRRSTPGEIREPVLWSIVRTLGPDGLAAVAFALWQHAANLAPGEAPSTDPFRPFAFVPAFPSGPIERAAVSLPAMALPAVPRTLGSAGILPLFYKS